MIDFVYNVPVLAVNREGVTGTGSEYQFKWEPFDPININGSYAYLDMSDPVVTLFYTDPGIEDNFMQIFHPISWMCGWESKDGLSRPMKIS